MSDHEQTGAQDQIGASMDDATMGSPKGGGTHPAGDTGPGRYGGADDTPTPATATPAGSEHSALSGPGATAGPDLGRQDALSTDGGSSEAMSGGTTASPSAGDMEGPGTGAWGDSQMRDRTQPWGDGDGGEVH